MFWFFLLIIYDTVFIFTFSFSLSAFFMTFIFHCKNAHFHHFCLLLLFSTSFFSLKKSAQLFWHLILFSFFCDNDFLSRSEFSRTAKKSDWVNANDKNFKSSALIIFLKIMWCSCFFILWWLYLIVIFMSRERENEFLFTSISIVFFFSFS